MILKRRGLENNLSQEDIAGYLNFCNTEETKKLFPQFPYNKDKRKQGCIVTSLNTQFFQPASIPLIENYHAIKYLDRYFDYSGEDFLDYLENLLKEEDDDVIASLNHAVILNKPGKVYRHASLVEYTSGRNVHLLTPKDNDKTYRETADIDIFYRAILNIDGGLWVIKTNTKN